MRPCGLRHKSRRPCPKRIRAEPSQAEAEGPRLLTAVQGAFIGSRAQGGSRVANAKHEAQPKTSHSAPPDTPSQCVGG